AGADVSGGLDSSAVAILAAGHGEIRAVTYHDLYCSSEDLDYARRVAGHISIPLHAGEGGEAELPFAWSPGQPGTERPVAMSLVMGQQRRYLGPVARWLAHLTGHGGDVVLDSCSAGFTALVQTGRRREARREVTMWARSRNRSPGQAWRAVTRAADLGHAGSLREAAAAIRRSGPEAFAVPAPWWQWCRTAPFTGWLTPAGRERVAGLLDDTASGVVEERADVAAQWDALRMVGADCRDTLPLATDWGIRPVHPYLDDRVVRAAFAIDPLERRSVTSLKPLLAAAVPKLPGWLTGRMSKGSFSRQLIAGARRRERELAALISTSPFVTGGLVDADRAVAALAGLGGHQSRSLFSVQRLAMACLWLATSESAGDREDGVGGREVVAC
ncbi:asparagine synthase-related protein, partial [Streptomyces clavuligerus]